MSDDDGQYFISKRSDRFFVGGRFGEDKNMRIMSEIFESDLSDHFAKIKDEIVIRRTPKSRFEIKATLTEDDRDIQVLTVQQWNVERGYPYDRTHFSFVGSEISRLLEFFQRVKTIHLDSSAGKNVALGDLVEVTLTPEQTKRLFSEREELVIDFATNEITRQDIIAIAYRKKELAYFERLLNDADFFASEGKRIGKTDEALWQAFFERNSWIFGHGLSYVFMTELEGRKLEQVVAGFDVSGPGKRADALLKTKAHLSSLAFVEIKRHDTYLLRGATYRPGVWAASEHLAGGVAQCHETVRAAGQALGDRLRTVDELGNPTGEDLLNVQPRSFLLIGQLSEFETATGPNMHKFRSFEAFRRNLHQPEILTFDELYYRARYIVDTQEIISEL